MKFPIIIIPDSFKKAKEKLPELPLEPTKPYKPDTSLKGCSLWLALGVLMFFLMLMNFGANNNNYDESLLIINFVGLLGLIPVFIWLHNSKKKRNIKKSIYEKELENLPKRIEEYEQKIREVLSPENLKIFREQELKRIIQLSSTAKHLDRVVNQGKYEPHFCTFLNKYFPDKIITSVSLGYFENPYAPDFAFIDRDSGLHIDIEIDEPYISQTKEPIHYIGADDNRNCFFENNNWVIIRFAEEQIVKQPLSCCKTIANTIFEIIGDKTYLNKLYEVEDVKAVNCWSYEESLFLARQNYRETY